MKRKNKTNRELLTRVFPSLLQVITLLATVVIDLNHYFGTKLNTALLFVYWHDLAAAFRSMPFPCARFNIFPTSVIRDRESYTCSVTATVSKPYVDCVTRAWDWRDHLIDTCPLVGKCEFSGVFRVTVVDLEFKLLACHVLIMHRQMASWLSFDYLQRKFTKR